MQEQKIVLTEPVTVGGKTVTELTVHKPKAKHLRGLRFMISDGGLNIESDTIIDLAVKLTGELPAVIDELGLEDITALGAAVMGFLPGGMLTAGKPQ
ncbi:MAG: phage tail assembly protein [Cloacibacillus sp.]